MEKNSLYQNKFLLTEFQSLAVRQHKRQILKATKLRLTKLSLLSKKFNELGFAYLSNGKKNKSKLQFIQFFLRKYPCASDSVPKIATSVGTKPRIARGAKLLEDRLYKKPLDKTKQIVQSELALEFEKTQLNEKHSDLSVFTKNPEFSLLEAHKNNLFLLNSSKKNYSFKPFLKSNFFKLRVGAYNSNFKKILKFLNSLGFFKRCLLKKARNGLKTSQNIEKTHFLIKKKQRLSRFFACGNDRFFLFLAHTSDCFFQIRHFELHNKKFFKLDFKKEKNKIPVKFLYWTDKKSVFNLQKNASPRKSISRTVVGTKPKIAMLPLDSKLGGIGELDKSAKQLILYAAYFICSAKQQIISRTTPIPRRGCFTLLRVPGYRGILLSEASTGNCEALEGRVAGVKKYQSLLKKISVYMPHKKSFFCYWLFPFLGFLSFVPFSKNHLNVLDNSQANLKNLPGFCLSFYSKKKPSFLQLSFLQLLKKNIQQSFNNIEYTAALAPANPKSPALLGPLDASVYKHICLLKPSQMNAKKLVGSAISNYQPLVNAQAHSDLRFAKEERMGHSYNHVGYALEHIAQALVKNQIITTPAYPRLSIGMKAYHKESLLNFNLVNGFYPFGLQTQKNTMTFDCLYTTLKPYLAYKLNNHQVLPISADKKAVQAVPQLDTKSFYQLTNMESNFQSLALLQNRVKRNLKDSLSQNNLIFLTSFPKKTTLTTLKNKKLADFFSGAKLPSFSYQKAFLLFENKLKIQILKKENFFLTLKSPNIVKAKNQTINFGFLKKSFKKITSSKSPFLTSFNKLNSLNKFNKALINYRGKPFILGKKGTLIENVVLNPFNALPRIRTSFENASTDNQVERFHPISVMKLENSYIKQAYKTPPVLTSAEEGFLKLGDGIFEKLDNNVRETYGKSLFGFSIKKNNQTILSNLLNELFTLKKSISLNEINKKPSSTHNNVAVLKAFKGESLSLTKSLYQNLSLLLDQLYTCLSFHPNLNQQEPSTGIIKPEIFWHKNSVLFDKKTKLNKAPSAHYVFWLKNQASYKKAMPFYKAFIKHGFNSNQKFFIRNNLLHLTNLRNAKSIFYFNQLLNSYYPTINRRLIIHPEGLLDNKKSLVSSVETAGTAFSYPEAFSKSEAAEGSLNSFLPNLANNFKINYNILSQKMLIPKIVKLFSPIIKSHSTPFSLAVSVPPLKGISAVHSNYSLPLYPKIHTGAYAKNANSTFENDVINTEGVVNAKNKYLLSNFFSRPFVLKQGYNSLLGGTKKNAHFYSNKWSGTFLPTTVGTKQATKKKSSLFLTLPFSHLKNLYKEKSIKYVESKFNLFYTLTKNNFLAKKILAKKPYGEALTLLDFSKKKLIFNDSLLASEVELTHKGDEVLTKQNYLNSLKGQLNGEEGLPFTAQAKRVTRKQIYFIPNLNQNIHFTSIVQKVKKMKGILFLPPLKNIKNQKSKIIKEVMFAPSNPIFKEAGSIETKQALWEPSSEGSLLRCEAARELQAVQRELAKTTFSIGFDQQRFSKLKHFYPLYTNNNIINLGVTKSGVKTRVDKLFRNLLSQSLTARFPQQGAPFKKTSIVNLKTLSNRLKIKYNLFTTLKTNIKNKQARLKTQSNRNAFFLSLPTVAKPEKGKKSQKDKLFFLPKNKETNLLIKNRFYKISNNFSKISLATHTNLKNNYAIEKAKAFVPKKNILSSIYSTYLPPPSMRYPSKESVPTKTVTVFVPKKRFLQTDNNDKFKNSLNGQNKLKKPKKNFLIKENNFLNFSQHRLPLSYEMKNNKFIYSLDLKSNLNLRSEKSIKRIAYKYFVKNPAKNNLKNEKLTSSSASWFPLPTGKEADSVLIRPEQTTDKQVGKHALLPSFNTNLMKSEKIKKNLQKKRRALKQRRETGRLLKRKRFYPRPTWLRLTMYRKFLNIRHRLPNGLPYKHAALINHSHPKDGLRKPPVEGSLLRSQVAGTHPLLCKEGSFRLKNLNNNYKRNPIFPNITNILTNLVLKNEIQNTKNTNVRIKWNSGSVFNDHPCIAEVRKPYKNIITHIDLRHYKNKQPKTPTYNPFNLILNKNNKLLFVNPSLLIGSESIGSVNNVFSGKKYYNTPIFDQTEFYNVSKNALTEFKQGLWNSSWLRANLNTYLRKIKLSFKQLKTITQHSTICYANHKESAYPQLRLLNFLNNKSYYLNGRQNLINPIPTLSQNLQKWEISIKKALLAEINYARIEQIITNIKYNLTGKPSSAMEEMRNESKSTLRKQIWNNARKKIKKPSEKGEAFSFFNSVISLIQRPSINLLNLSFELPFFTLRNEGLTNQASLEKVYWAINKTHMWLYKNGNKKKYLWANQKQREQNRSNKTKNFINNIVTLISKPIQETYPVKSAQATEVPRYPEGVVSHSYAGLILGTLRNGSVLENYHLFLKKQKQKENKMNYLGFLDTNLPFPKSHFLLPLKNNDLTSVAYSLEGKESNLATFLFSHNYKKTTNATNTKSFSKTGSLVSTLEKNGILKEHKVFLRHLKAALSLQGFTLSETNSNYRKNPIALVPQLFAPHSLKKGRMEIPGADVGQEQQTFAYGTNRKTFLKPNLNYYYSYICLYNQQKKANGLLKVGKSYMKHRANNYLEKRLKKQQNYPYIKKTLSNFVLKSSIPTSHNFFEITKISHLNLLNPYNFHINFTNSTNTFFYLIFVMCTIQIFHLCSLFSLTSSAEIRSVIKFFILFSLKITYLYLGLTRTIFLSLSNNSSYAKKIKNAFFKEKNNFEKSFFSQKLMPILSRTEFDNKQNTSTIRFFSKNKNLLREQRKSFLKESVSLKNYSFNPFGCEAKFVGTLVKKFKINFNSSQFLSFNMRKLPFAWYKAGVPHIIYEGEPLAQQDGVNYNKFSLRPVKTDKPHNFFTLQTSLKGEKFFYKSPLRKAEAFKKVPSSLKTIMLNENNKLKKLKKKIPRSLTWNKLPFFSASDPYGRNWNRTATSLKSFTKLNYLKKDISATTNNLFYKINFNNKFVKTSQIIKTKIVSINILNTLLKVSINTSYFCYRLLLKAIEIPKTGLQSIYIFCEKPGELLSDWITHLFLIEIASDLTTTIPENTDSTLWNSFSKFAKSSSIRIIPIFGTALEKRLFNCFQTELVEILSQPDTDLIVRQKKVSYAWDIWGEILKNVAEKNSINISLLTNKKEDQAFLISKLLENNDLSFDTKIKNVFNNLLSSTRTLRNKNKETTATFKKIGVNFLFKTQKNKVNWELNKKKNYKNFNITLPEAINLFISGTSKEVAFLEKNINLLRRPIIKKNKLWQRWSANQFMTYKGKDSDLFIQAPPAPSVAKVTFKTIKQLRTIQAPLGNIICQIYSGLFSKKTAKNFLVVGASSFNSNFDEKSLLIQSLAGETEMKIIRDNANRYNFTLGIKSLRNVFDALALHTPCIFLIEDIHVIGERRPFLVGDDENAKAVQNSSGIEPHQPLGNDEKNLSISKLTRHVVMHYKKPFRGDYSNLIPTNNYSFNLFLGVSSPRAREHNLTPLSPILLEKESTPFLTKSPIFVKASILQAKQSLNLIGSQKNNRYDKPTKQIGVQTEINTKTNQTKNTVKEIPWLGLPEQTTMSNELSKQTSSIRVKIALLAHLAVSNLSVKLNMITDLLVIIDSVRSNRGFVVFATTHTPSILDPALRRPGRLDETIALPFIPKLENRWEIVKSNFISLNSAPSFFSFSGISNNNFLFKGKSESGFPFGLTVDLLDYAWQGYPSHEATQSLQNSALQIQTALKKFKKTQSKMPQIPCSLVPTAEKLFLKKAPFFTISVPPRLNETFFSNNILEPSILNKLASKISIYEKKRQFFCPIPENRKKKKASRDQAHNRLKTHKKILPNLIKTIFFGNKKIKNNKILVMRSAPTFTRVAARSSAKQLILYAARSSAKQPLRGIGESGNRGIGESGNRGIGYYGLLRCPMIGESGYIPTTYPKGAYPTPPIGGEGGIINKARVKGGVGGLLLAQATGGISSKKNKTNKLFLEKTLIAIAYSKIGQLLINNKFAFNYNKVTPLLTTLHSQLENQNGKKEYESPYLHLYTKQQTELKQILMNLFTAKVTETFAFSKLSFNQQLKSSAFSQLLGSVASTPSDSDWVPNKGSLNSFKNCYANKENNQVSKDHTPVVQATVQNQKGLISNKKQNKIPILRLLSLQSIDKTWRTASSLIFAYIEKQLIYKKSLVIPKLLQFYNAAIQSSTLQDPPSAPSSFLLLPAKRYENYKRSFSAMQNQNAAYDLANNQTSSNFKRLELHQKRILKKKLYALFENTNFNNSTILPFDPTKKQNLSLPTAALKKEPNNHSETQNKKGIKNIVKEKSLNPGKLNLDNMSEVLLSVSNYLEKPTSNNITRINSYYRNRLLNRHRGYINNQWWNGQLSEHNVETTFLSDVDWRSNFISSLIDKGKNKNKQFYGSLLKDLPLRSQVSLDQKTFINSRNKRLEKLESQVNFKNINEKKREQSSLFDSLIDYPDFDQHYNPKNRRWILNFGYWSYWSNYQKDHNKEIYSYLVMESFLNTFHYLNSNREILDYLTTKFITLGLLKENTLIDSIKRF